MNLSIRRNLTRIAMVSGVALLSVACAPEIQIRAPKDPIVINLNIKIEHEIRVKVERSVDDLLETEKGLF